MTGKIVNFVSNEAIDAYFRKQSRDFNISKFIRECIMKKIANEIDLENLIARGSAEIDSADDDKEKIEEFKRNEIAEKNAELMRCKEKRETNMIKSEIIRKIARSIFDSPFEVRKSRYDQFIATTMKDHKSELDELLKERGIIFDS
jgi:hypothetical protein